MARLTRTFTLGLAALALLTAPLAAQDKYLPEKTDVVFNVNLKGLLDSGLVKKYALDKLKAAMDSNADFKRICEDFKLDPMKDIHSVQFGVGSIKIKGGAGGPPQPNVDDLVIVVKGNFNVSAIQSKLEQGGDKVKTTTKGQHKIYEFTEGKDPMAGTFVDSKTMLLAKKPDQVAALLDRAGSGGLNKDLTAMLGKVNTQAEVWMAMQIPQAARDEANKSGQGQIVEKIDGLTMSALVKDDLKLDLTIHTKGADVAQQIQSLLEVGRGFIENQQNPDAPPFLDELFKKITISASGNSVSIKADLPPDLIEKIAKYAKEKADK